VIRGDGSVDTQALRNMSECQKRGYPFGVYIFFDAWTEATARALMRKLVTISAKYGPRCYMDDIEKWLPKAVVLAGLDELRKLGITGVNGAPFVMSYMGEWRWQSRYRAILEKLVDAVCIANYGKNNGTVSKVPVVPHDLHQYTSVATVPGISDKTCDRNRLSGRRPLEWFTGRKYEAVSER
jgi:GH25 family lysozyme M1 (1,4-beta-N-acetylmuramidase)